MNTKEAIAACISEDLKRERPQDALNILLDIPNEEKTDEIHFAIGRVYHLQPADETEQQKAITHYTTAAELGHPVAMHNLGACYSYGEGVEQNPKAAFAWFQKAANLQEPNGMNGVATCYAKGEGVEQDMKAALKWYQKAADHEEPYAMYNLGTLYQSGRGVERNEETAIIWYEKSLSLGNQNPLFNLGEILSNRGINERAVGINSQDHDKIEAAQKKINKAKDYLTQCIKFWGSELGHHFKIVSYAKPDPRSEKALEIITATRTILNEIEYESGRAAKYINKIPLPNPVP